MESLKNQLEKTQSELHDVQINNSALKSHLHSLGHDSVHLDSLHCGQVGVGFKSLFCLGVCEEKYWYYIYSQTCRMWPVKGDEKSGHLGQVAS